MFGTRACFLTVIGTAICASRQSQAAIHLRAFVRHRHSNGRAENLTVFGTGGALRHPWWPETDETEDLVPTAAPWGDLGVVPETLTE